MTLQAPAPQVEIGYAQAVNYNWWLYENETTPELIWPQSTFVFDSMRRTDSQVTSVLRAMTLPVRRTPWRIDPNGASPKVVQFVADDLGLPIVGQKAPKPPPRSKDRFSWPDHLRQALLMLSYGHMYFEQVYRVDPDGSAAHLRKLAPRMPKTIERIDVAADGGLISIKQWWSPTNSGGTTIPVNRLVAYIHEREGGNWLGTSILRPAYKNWLLKDRLLRVQAQTIERNGMGIPLYKGAENASNLDAGLAMAKAWRAGDAAGSAVPFGADLILRGVEGTLPDAEPAVRYHDEQIGRAVLAHFLNLGTQTGSWALGTTFADFFTLSLQTLADQVADTATQHIVEDLVDINFGEDEPAPRIVCDEIGSRQAATAEALAALIDSGVIRPDEVLEESSRQQYGLPPADPKTTRTPPTPGGGQPPIPTDGSAAPGDIAPADAPDATGTDASAAVAAMQGVAASGRAARVTAKFNPDEPRMPDGKWGTGGVVGDALKLAGKIDLEPGETLVGSSKVKADTGTVRMAVTEQHGHRSVRLGIGDAAFGGREDEAGPWRAGRNDLRDRNSKADALSRERGRLEAEHDALSATHDPLVAKYRATAHGGPALSDAEHAELERLAARRDAIANRLDEIDSEDTDAVSASGYTTKLDTPQVQQLHAALTAALARAKAAEPEHQRAWDAVPDGINPDLPLADLGSGSIPGQWGDVHYLGFIDEPELGPQFELAVVPHGMTLPDVRDAETHATLDARETALFLRQLAKAGDIRAKARPSVVNATAEPSLLGEDVDEQADAITAALDEWVDAQLPEEVEAKFNPDELRVPGGKGGGRWTANPIGKAISDALDAWGKGKGPDDPFTFDGKPIDREPLRKAAVARGITLKRGASREDIVHALLGGVRDEVKTQRAERQKRVGSSKFSIDVGGKVDPEAAREVEVENHIRAAYSDLLAEKPNGATKRLVSLADLRDRLAEDNIRGAEVDMALKRLITQPGVNLIPESNQSDLTPRLRSASARIGGQDKHHITIADPSPRPMPTPVGGKRIDVAVYTGIDPNAPSLREISSANRPGRVITSQPDLAGLEQWAHDNGHADVAQWAASERARAEAKSAPKTHPTDTGGRITEAEAWKRMHGDKPMPAKVAKKAAPRAKKVASTDVTKSTHAPPPSGDELKAIAEVHGRAAHADGGWVRKSDMSPASAGHLDGLVEQGWLQKHSGPDGDLYRVDPRSAGTRKGQADSAALVGDVLPAPAAADSTLKLTTLNRGAIIEGHVGPDGTFSNEPTPGSRPVRVVVQRVEPLDQHGQPVKAPLLGGVGELGHFQMSGEKPMARIIGHDADTGRRIESDVVRTNSRWSWHMNPDTNTSADIEGEIVPTPQGLSGAPKVPAKKAASKATKSTPKVDRSPASAADRAHHILIDPTLTDRQKRSRLKSAGLAPDEVDRLVPTKAAAAKATKAAPKAAKATPSAPHPDGLDAYEGPRLKSYAAEFLDSTSGMDDNQLRAALRAQGVGSPAVEQAKRAAEDAAAPKVKAGPSLAEAQLDNRILSNYRAWTMQGRPGRKGDALPLETLRQHMGNVSPEEFDAAVKRLTAHGAEVTPSGIRVTNSDSVPLPPAGWPKLSSNPAERLTQIQDRIEQTYRELATRPGGDFASLTNVRDRLGPDVSRDEFDRAVIDLSRRPDVKVVPESNQKMLTARDRAASVSIGNQDRHLIMITDPSPAGGARPKGEGRPPEAALARSVASGVTRTTPLTQGKVGETRIDHFGDGHQAVYKKSTQDWNGANPKDQADAEELASLVGQSLGAPVPAAHRIGDDEIYLDYVHNAKTGDELGFAPYESPGIDPEGSHLLGLTGLLINDPDQHSGNYMVDGDNRVHGIDHGLAWSPTAMGMSPDMAPQQPGPFGRDFIQPGGMFGSPTFKAGPFSADELKAYRKRIEALQADFERLGRDEWHQFALARLDALIAAAGAAR